MDLSESPLEPFFADKFMDVRSRKGFQCKANVGEAHLNYDNSASSALARAAVLHFMLKGYMVKY